MSRENVELNHRSHDAFNRRDLEDFIALNDPEVEFTPYERAIEGSGPLARGRLRGQGSGSGASFERAYWGVFRWRDGKIVWWHAYDSEADALAAAGLPD